MSQDRDEAQAVRYTDFEVDRGLAVALAFMNILVTVPGPPLR